MYIFLFNVSYCSLSFFQVSVNLKFTSLFFILLKLSPRPSIFVAFIIYVVIKTNNNNYLYDSNINDKNCKNNEINS